MSHDCARCAVLAMGTSVRVVSSLCIAAIVLGALGARAADMTVDAGALRAVVATDPWRVTFVDADGGVVLADALGNADAAGRFLRDVMKLTMESRNVLLFSPECSPTIRPTWRPRSRSARCGAIRRLGRANPS